MNRIGSDSIRMARSRQSFSSPGSMGSGRGVVACGLTANGKALWHNVMDAPIYNDEVIRPLDKPLVKDGGIRVLRGNLAPRGAVLKP